MYFYMKSKICIINKWQFHLCYVPEPILLSSFELPLSNALL